MAIYKYIASNLNMQAIFKQTVNSCTGVLSPRADLDIKVDVWREF